MNTVVKVVGGLLLASAIGGGIYLATRGAGLSCEDYGDLNYDGKVDSADYQILAQYFENTLTLTPDQLIRANVKGYGEVNVVDLQLMAQYINGTIVKFPVCA